MHLLHEVGVEDLFINGERTALKSGGLENGDCFMRGLV